MSNEPDDKPEAEAADAAPAKPATDKPATAPAGLTEVAIEPEAAASETPDADSAAPAEAEASGDAQEAAAEASQSADASGQEASGEEASDDEASGKDASGEDSAAQDNSAQDNSAQDNAPGDAQDGQAAADDAAPAKAASDDAAASDDGSSDDEAGDEASGDESEEAQPEPDLEPDEALIARVRGLFSPKPAAEASAGTDESDDDGAAEDDSGTSAEPGPFRFARWARPIAPRVYGVESQSADTLMTAFKRVTEAAGAPYAVEDEVYGANVLVFVCSEWLELKATPKLETLVPQLDQLIGVLRVTEANTWRLFGHDESGAIDFAVILLRVDDQLGALSGEAVALDQAVRTLVDWSDDAFEDEKPLKIAESGRASLKPFTEAVLAAAYEEDVPAVSEDPALAETLARSVVKRMASSSNSGRGDSRRGNARRRRRGSGRRRRSDSGAEA